MKTSRHLTLEAVNVLYTRTGDDQVIHIYANDELLLPPSPRVERVLGRAPLEPKLAQLSSLAFHTGRAYRSP